MEGAADTTLRAAGALLLTGGALAVIGAWWPPYKQWMSPLEESLRVIASHPIGWRCIHAGFLGGTWVSLAGLALFAYARRGQPGGTLALLAAVAFGLAAVCFTVNIGYRLSVQVWAARELVATGSIPPGFAPWRAFASLMFAGFSLAAYLAVAGLGWSAMQAGLLGRGLGITLMVWGLSGGFVVGANVPFIAYVPYVIVGALLLRR